MSTPPAPVSNARGGRSRSRWLDLKSPESPATRWPKGSQWHPRPRRGLRLVLYPDPWVHGLEPEPVDRLILATARANDLAAHLAQRLECLANLLDGSVADLADLA